MSYQVLARKYRPQTFAEVVGQEHVVRTLGNAIQTGRIAHAFLFVGPRGIGKTSLARILAKALNCSGGPRADFDPNEEICREIAEGRSLDVLEIDGASNNGVEQVRDLRDNVQYAPSKGKFKIYIIDEVHMLSTAAFNALLKTLEEPPAHVKFIFATTEAHKLPATILSRCQRFDLKRISDEAIIRHLGLIAEKEGITVSREALVVLARNAEGGMRDAESAFDQLISFCGKDIAEKDALEVFGLTGIREIWDLTEAVQAGDAQAAIRQVRELTGRGKDLIQLTREMLRYFRNELLYLISPEMAKEELDPTEYHHFDAAQPLPGRDTVLAWIEELVRLEEKIRYALVKEVLFEITIIRLTQQREKIALEEILKKLAGGENPAAPALPSQTAPTARPAATLPVSSTTSVPTRAPAPAPTPAAAPVSAVQEKTSPPIPAAAPEALNPQAAWNKVAEDFLKQRPLLAAVIRAFEFQGFEDSQVVLRLEADSGARQNVQTPKNTDLLQSLIREHFGPGAGLDLRVVDPPPPPPSEIPAATETKAEPSKKAAPAPERKAAPAVEISRADFTNDPLIQAAMKEFEARIVQINP